VFLHESKKGEVTPLLWLDPDLQRDDPMGTCLDARPSPLYETIVTEEETTMWLKLGEPVRSLDGHDIGTIKYLILDPSGEEVKTLVVEKGWLLPQDIELPREALQAAEDGSIQAAYTAEQVKHLPHFHESQYTPAPPQYLSAFTNYPVGGVLWPGAYTVSPFAAAGYALPVVVEGEERVPPQLPEVEDYLREQEQSNAVISAGADVFSQDGKKVGEVHSLTFDSVTGHPASIVIRRGWLFPEDTELPADAIASVDDGIVSLRLNKDQL
jgi:uncharacterized protein YrrD